MNKQKSEDEMIDLGTEWEEGLVIGKLITEWLLQQSNEIARKIDEREMKVMMMSAVKLYKAGLSIT